MNANREDNNQGESLKTVNSKKKGNDFWMSSNNLEKDFGNREERNRHLRTSRVTREKILMWNRFEPSKGDLRELFLLWEKMLVKKGGKTIGIIIGCRTNISWDLQFPNIVCTVLEL